MSRRTRSLALAATLLLAAALRIHGLGTDSLWGDEGLSLRIARMGLVDLVRYDIAWEQIPPVHHLLLHFWIPLFGDSEFSVRLPSAIAGVASVWMAYVLVARLLPGPTGRRAALLAALLTAASPVMVEYAQEARAYALAVLLAQVSTYLFVTLGRRPTPLRHAAYAASSALLIYTHLYGVFVLLAHHAAYAWRLWLAWRRDGSGGGTGAALAAVEPSPRSWVADNLAVAALYAPWVPVVLQWVRLVNVSFWVKRASWDDITRAYWMYAGSTALLLAMVALTVLGCRRLLRQGPAARREALPLLLALATLPVLIPATASVLGRPSFAARYAMVACVGLYPLMAVGLASLPWAWLRAGAAAAVVALALAARNGEATNIPKERWREAMAYLDARLRPGDIATVHIKALTRLYDYYVRRPDVPRRGFDGPALPLSLPRPPGQSVWLVYRGEWYPLRVTLIRGPWRVVSARNFDGVLVMQLEENHSPEFAATAPAPAPRTSDARGASTTSAASATSSAPAAALPTDAAATSAPADDPQP